MIRDTLAATIAFAMLIAVYLVLIFTPDIFG
jgi:hypothetical protein